MQGIESKEKVKTKKVIRYKRDYDKMLVLAQKRLEEGDYLTALGLLNSIHREDDLGLDGLLAAADAYEMAEAYSRAIDVWYAYLNICPKEYVGDAYEGLAVSYMNLGKETQAAYYYNLLLQVADDISEESKMEIVETFSKPKRSPFHFVYPPALADYSSQLEEGLRLLKEGKFELSRQAFAQIPVGSDQYRSAQNLLAIAYLMDDKGEEAERICGELIASDKTDVQAYTTYAAVMGQTGKSEKAKEIAAMLCKMTAKDTDEKFKIATVCCENGLHAEALKLFCELDEELPNDKSILFFKGVSACKSGDLALGLQVFQTLTTIYPHAAVAATYRDIVSESLQSGSKAAVEQLDYFYTVPADVRKKYIQTLKAVAKISSYNLYYLMQECDIERMIDWCFDETEGMDFELQELALDLMIHGKMYYKLQELLLNADVTDVLKVSILERFAQTNYSGEMGLVICHIYRKVLFLPIRLGVKRRKKMLECYASVYAKFAILSEGHAHRVCASAELLYNCLQVSDKIELLDNTAECAAVIYLLSGIKEGGGTLKAACSIFLAKEELVEYIQTIVTTLTNQLSKEEAQGE